MGYPNLESCFFPTAAYYGKILIADLGYPNSFLNALAPKIFTLDPDFFKAILPKRYPWGSKKNHGLCMLVAGSRNMPGAARLAAEACMRSGAGMTWLVTAADVVGSLASQLPEVIYCGVPTGPSGSLGLEALAKIQDLSPQMNAVCIGPGLSVDDATQNLIQNLIEVLQIPVVLDADGLNAFKNCVAKLKLHNAPLIITPHSGEWERLFGSLDSDPVKRVAQIVKVAQEYKLVIVLKGKPTLVASPDGEVYLLNGGSSGMATAGSGDVLSGILCALLAQGCSVLNAALLGVWLHQKAGEMATEHLGEYSMLASDITGHLYLAFKALDEHQI
jgi:NAD(P)H-hydrate epimerase